MLLTGSKRVCEEETDGARDSFLDAALLDARNVARSKGNVLNAWRERKLMYSGVCRAGTFFIQIFS